MSLSVGEKDADGGKDDLSGVQMTQAQQVERDQRALLRWATWAMRQRGFYPAYGWDAEFKAHYRGRKDS